MIWDSFVQIINIFEVIIKLPTIFSFHFQEGTQSEVDREKRKIFGPDVGFGVKNAILGYVFGVSWIFSGK